MFTALVFVALGVPAATSEPPFFQLEVGASIDGVVTPYASSTPLVHTSLGPGLSARALFDDALWVDAWVMLGVLNDDWQLTPIPEELNLNVPTIHASLAAGWRWSLVDDGVFVSFGVGPSLDTRHDFCGDCIGTGFGLGAMAIGGVQWRVAGDLSLGARAAVALVPWPLPPTGAAIVSAGLSWTFR